MLLLYNWLFDLVCGSLVDPDEYVRNVNNRRRKALRACGVRF